MNQLVLAGTAVAATAYAFLLYGAWTGKEYQNPATFLLWGVLNAIATTSLWLAGSSTFWLVAFYTVSSLAMAGVLSRKGWRRWEFPEWLAALMVLISIAVWWASDAKMAAVASTFGIIVAAIPLLNDLRKDPRRSPFREYVELTLANSITFAAAKNWSVEEMFYPGACIILMLVTLWLSARQFFSPYRQQSAT